MLLLIKKKEKKALCCDIHSQQRQKGSPYLIKGLLGRFLEFLKGQKEKTQVPDGVFSQGLPHTLEMQVSDGTSAWASSLSLRSTEFWSEVEVQGNCLLYKCLFSHHLVYIC